MPLRCYLGSPRLECVHQRLGPQSHHFLADSHVAVCVYVSPFSSVPVSLSVHHWVLFALESPQASSLCIQVTGQGCVSSCLLVPDVVFVSQCHCTIHCIFWVSDHQRRGYIHVLCHARRPVCVDSCWHTCQQYVCLQVLPTWVTVHPGLVPVNIDVYLITQAPLPGLSWPLGIV